MKKILVPILALAISIVTSCNGEKKEAVAESPAIPVKVSAIAENSNSSFVSASGKIEAANSADLSTRMMGYVTKLHVTVGQKVAAGQTLVSINNTDLLAKKAQVDAGILQATAGYNNAKKDYDRFVNLFKQQSASQKELDDMTARYEMAKASLEGAKQMKNEVMAQFNYSNITAPISGVVTNTFVKAGDMANPGMPLLSIEGASKLQVSAMVSESDITAIKKGMPVTVLVKSSNEKLAGTVSEVSISAKNTGGQYLVKIDLNKTNSAVLSGMFVNVQFPIEHKTTTTTSTNAVLIPESALVHQGQLTGIYTIGTNNVAILRWLRTGKTFGDQIEVLSGLSANESYIVSADGKLFNGAKVSVQQ
ncbi:MAG: efflux RND transporter periplasmic adaptor subunit [Flavobacteriaceae bacterium]|uniref:Efflux RND transporter periplasmic adaptor subunit n=1 Tax=Flavobacterium kayseriense TaxID=2764714 RepID=A0ABR7JAY3_9FLAO|nr:efflux RND transporter periplasmic adaptor subunit [Flavobacterium kayseriense]MBC5842689.1 efflux RND transporter periplasmic adaptor subunit [Flavobacterium kayseriense]MBC5849219.1 efflux RND transporter periplasmic adaptor subunit [Flavobacterium kayseriense]MBX9887019.1 efflux RND transporter periplasmic adaptor subunit [Flavobacteriaceae bacterium]